MADARMDSPARLYAKIVGVAVLLVGVVGLIIGDPEDGLLGLFNVDIVEDIVHLATGGLLTYVGFAGTNRAVKSVVTALGVVYLLIGVIGFFVPELFGLIPHEYSLADNILHLTLGALALFAVLGNSAKESNAAPRQA
jgi:preprotein translocase subunit Sss1